MYINSEEGGEAKIALVKTKGNRSERHSTKKGWNIFQLREEFSNLLLLNLWWTTVKRRKILSLNINVKCLNYRRNGRNSLCVRVYGYVSVEHVFLNDRANRSHKVKLTNWKTKTENQRNKEMKKILLFLLTFIIRRPKHNCFVSPYDPIKLKRNKRSVSVLVENRERVREREKEYKWAEMVQKQFIFRYVDKCIWQERERYWQNEIGRQRKR